MTATTGFGYFKSVLLGGWSLQMLIAGSIAFNALYLQQSRHPAPFYTTRLSTADAILPTVPARTTVHSVQDKLLRIGFYSGSLDGIAGPETEAAIIRFERAARLPVTGRISQSLLASLDLALKPQSQAGPNENAGAADSVERTEALPDPMVAAVQKALSDAAYGPLVSDGIIGSRTIDAINRFQLDQGMTVTSKMDDNLIARLIEIGAMGAGQM